MTTESDYVIVGGGTAGAVLARRLAEDPEVSVVLLEAGPSDEGIEVIADLARWAELLGDERYGHDYVIEPQARGNGRILHSRGVMLGGCSSHNSAISFQPPPYDFDRWSELGAAGWSARDVAPYFDRVRERVDLEPSEHDNAAVLAFVAAAAAHGFRERDFALDVDEGVGLFQLAKRGDRRVSSSTAYLHPLAALPPNLEVRTGARVLDLVLDGTRVRGVRTDAGPMHAEREVVLCAGAIGTPVVLLRSGIGPAAHLRHAGVRPVHDLDGVGEHLQDHPEGVLVFAAARPVPDVSAQRYEAGLFARIDADAHWPDMMFHFGTEAFDMHTVRAGYPTASNAFSITPNVTRARSEGTVRLRASDPAGDPAIDFAYFSDPEGYDERIMVAGVELAREIVACDPLAAWTARELAPGPSVQGFAAISEYARSTANTVYHPVGTCRMGRADDPDAVVGPDLLVRGLEGLRIADASIFPRIVSTNPAITCMMIGERAADLIRGRTSA